MPRKSLTREQTVNLIGKNSDLDDSDSDPTFEPVNTSESNYSYISEDVCKVKINRTVRHMMEKMVTYRMVK